MINSSPSSRHKASPMRQSDSYIRELEQRLREKEADAALAADIGQQLLRQVQQLQEQLLNQRDSDTENSCPQSIPSQFSPPTATNSPVKRRFHQNDSVQTTIISDLQKTNAELMDRCDFQTNLVRQMQKATGEAEEKIWQLELNNQDLLDKIETLNFQSRQDKMALESLKAENAKLTALYAVENDIVHSPSAGSKRLRTERVDRSCSPMKFEIVEDAELKSLRECLRNLEKERDDLLNERSLMFDQIMRLGNEREDLQNANAELHDRLEFLHKARPKFTAAGDEDMPNLDCELNSAISKDRRQSHNRASTIANLTLLIPSNDRQKPLQHERIPTVPGAGITIEIAKEINRRQSGWTLQKLCIPPSLQGPTELIDPGASNEPTDNTFTRVNQTRANGKLTLNMSLELIHAMIGLWADKKSGGGRGRRFFWIIPWSRKLCWSKAHLSLSDGAPTTVRSLFIRSFDIVDNDAILVSSGSYNILLKPLSVDDCNLWAAALRAVQEAENIFQ